MKESRRNHHLRWAGIGQASEVHWLQRLDRFGGALAQLDQACAKDSYTDLERAGLVYIFMFTNELSWKTLQALLISLGSTVNSPRDTIRQAFKAGYLNEDDCEAFLRALDTRNRLSHICSADEALFAEDSIKGEFLDVLGRLQITLERMRNE